MDCFRGARFHALNGTGAHAPDCFVSAIISGPVFQITTFRLRCSHRFSYPVFLPPTPSCGRGLSSLDLPNTRQLDGLSFFPHQSNHRQDSCLHLKPSEWWVKGSQLGNLSHQTRLCSAPTFALHWVTLVSQQSSHRFLRRKTRRPFWFIFYCC